MELSSIVDNHAPKPSRPKRLSLKQRDSIYGYFFIAPQILGYFLFVLGPLVAVFFFSLQDRSLLMPLTRFIGFDHYVTMFTADPLFRQVIANTLIFSASLVPLNIILALILALLVSRKMRGVTIFRTAYFAPVVTSAAAWAIIWSFMLQGENGTINQYLSFLGIQGPNWLFEPGWAMAGVVISRVIMMVGINMIIFLTGIMNLPEELFDAASVDGANFFQTLWNITLPLLAPTTLLVSILCLIGSLRVFDTIFLMTRGGPGNSTMVLMYFIYYQAFQVFDTGYASALSAILFLITLSFTLIQWVLRRRFVYNER